jgi:hypothetical protein
VTAFASGASFEDASPVERWQDVAFELVHAPAFLGLVEREGLLGPEVVVELREDDLGVAGDERARG